MTQDKDESAGRDCKVSVIIEGELHSWLWRERRRRDRSIAWIVNQAIKQYKDRIERGASK